MTTEVRIPDTKALHQLVWPPGLHGAGRPSWGLVRELVTYIDALQAAARPFADFWRELTEHLPPPKGLQEVEIGYVNPADGLRWCDLRRIAALVPKEE